MTRWEYLVESDSHELGEGEYADDWTEQQLNSFGKQGWEAISVKSGSRRIPGGTSDEWEAWYRAHLKRKKK